MNEYEYIRQNAKNIAATFMFCTVIWGRLIYTDMPLYIFNFQTPHENCKKFRKPYLKTMSSTIESLKTSVHGKKPKSAYIDIMGKVGKRRENHRFRTTQTL